MSPTERRDSNQKCLWKKLFLKILTGKQLYWSIFLIKVAGLHTCNFIKETPTQVLSCEYSEIFKNAYFEEHLRATASRLRIGNKCGILATPATLRISKNGLTPYSWPFVETWSNAKSDGNLRAFYNSIKVSKRKTVTCTSLNTETKLKRNAIILQSLMKVMFLWQLILSIYTWLLKKSPRWLRQLRKIIRKKK